MQPNNTYRFDNEAYEECKRIQRRIFDTRGINITLVEASRILTWKSQNSSKMLTNSKLLEVLGRSRNGRRT